MFMSVLDLWVVASDRLGESTMNAREKRGRGERGREGREIYEIDSPSCRRLSLPQQRNTQSSRTPNTYCTRHRHY